MRSLDCVAERFPQSGAIAGQGASQILGRPPFSPLVLAIREAVQNSWDARQDRSDAGHVSIRIEYCHLNKNQSAVLTEEVLLHDMERWPLLNELQRLRSAEDIPILVLTDSGTMGLNGPTTADTTPVDEDHTRFRGFVRNIGEGQIRSGYGGMYGFGKSSLFGLSAYSTILVYSATTNERGEDESRFIAMGIDKSFDHHGTRHTGRYWWGRAQGDHNALCEPVIGADAESLASTFGMKIPSGDYGTSIAIVDPRMHGEDDVSSKTRTEKDMIEDLTESLLLNFWPKMIRSSNDQPPIGFSVIWDGERIHTPDPARHEIVRSYVLAYDELKKAPSGSESTPGVHPIRYGQRQEEVGTLSVKPCAVLTHIHDTSSFRPIRMPRHVALIRAPELVVKYLETPEHPEGLPYTGVFRVGRSHDRTFALAEPPSHDDWVPDTMEDPQARSIVRTTMRKIPLAVEAIFGAASDTGGSTLTGLAAIGDLLGNLLLSDGDAGPESPAGPSTPGSPGDRKLRVDIESQKRIPVGDADEIRLSFKVHAPRTAKRAIVEVGARPANRFVREVGSTDNPVTVDWWEDPAGDRYLSTAGDIREREVALPMRHAWTVVIRCPRNIAASVVLKATRSG